MHNINKILKVVKSTIKTAFHGDIDVFIHVTVDNTVYYYAWYYDHSYKKYREEVRVNYSGLPLIFYK